MSQLLPIQNGQPQAQTPKPSVKSFAMVINYIGVTPSGKEMKYYKDSVVTGQLIQSNSQKVASGIKTTEGFFLPMNVLREVPPIQLDSEKDMIGQTKSIVNTSAFKQGAFLGAMLGAGFSFFSNRNMFYTVMMGMVIGGASGYFMKTNKSSKKD